MQLHFVRVTRCKVCRRRAVWLSGMCKPCIRIISTHHDLMALDYFLDAFYPKAPR